MSCLFSGGVLIELGEVGCKSIQGRREVWRPLIPATPCMFTQNPLRLYLTNDNLLSHTAVGSINAPMRSHDTAGPGGRKHEG